MSKLTHPHHRLTPRERLSRGLAHSALGPVDVTRGVVGLGTHSAHSTAAALRRRYQRGRLARDIGELELAGTDVATKLPQTLRDASHSRRRRGKRPLLLTGAAVLALAGGAAAFSKVRRSMRPDYDEHPSPRPPSVDVEPRP